ncbi:NACHT domain-containing NTPase [Aetokthonos hydrillicola Thurmond2011]|jgi:predicted NACHT family NTPase|uniref:NACHT domain-containing NTPase n=1 Tax=Aetokthonos hydrillicola Thurmond2011 TaxID=2712845 RepID=A0AAP5IGB7_9CYAN|nr:NACHT domain-containing NTPase [Aetokthonos hydrillicola]MBO3458094.1 NACHT domain-containing NTPase [Aetokthonos hydrillicola CCALA 1050]MBW4587069.1 NACHT domain-containing NTPase [Aetokthonos hydrillicola CCALA 1050]MDR9899682.1 NACHT domain-containing NTPase [Aetokthonos hydrillicola Thurmond2011]
MAKRSLQASIDGIRRAKHAFKYKGWTQEYLAAEVGLETRQPIWKFFSGKPVDRQVFYDICYALDLDPENIVQKPEAEEEARLVIAQQDVVDIDTLVSKARAAHFEKIRQQCSTLHVVDIARPLQLDELYVEVNILEEITSQRWLEISDFKTCGVGEADNCVCRSSQESFTGIEVVSKYTKLMVLGKPGSGKTTFLQSIALRCNQKEFKPDHLPIFITLKDFAEDAGEVGQNQSSLFNYISEEFVNFGISEQDITTILLQGRCLILLDGLDEVTEKDNDKVIKEIRHFTDKFYKNHIVITCRIAAQTYKFKGFTEVEIADFTQTQIAAFAERWFLAVAKKPIHEAKAFSSEFIQKLNLPENQQIQGLVNTPILLNLTCLVFQFLKDFPKLRSELYQQGLDLLLVRWDELRGVKRDEIYRNLSLPHKIKLLSRLAAITFTEEDCFFSENKIQQIISEYLSELTNAPTDVYNLELKSRDVLKSIEAQHGLLVERARGIYSFSHLTFQEYFTAKEVVAHANSQTLLEFVAHIRDKRWREVFLLTAEMLHPADELLQLIKQQIDTLVTSSKKLQDFLNWLSEKFSRINAPYHPASVRAFYFTLVLPPEHSLSRNQDLALSLDHRLAGKLNNDLALDLALIDALSISLVMNADIFFQRLSAMSLSVDLEYLLQDYPSLREKLQRLKNQLPLASQGKESLKAWWLDHGEAWTEQLRNFMISDRQIGHNWQFYENDWQLLQQYWDDNKLLLDCLNSAGDVSFHVRQSIEENLFMLSQ